MQHYNWGDFIRSHLSLKSKM